MFDTIILLTGPVERAALPAALVGHNPSLTVLSIESAGELAALSGDVLRRARLVAYVTPVIVPKSILDQLGYGAFNFHPGPPSYPGWAPAHFALYDQAAEFGATVHVMVERVDAGPIIEVTLFPVPPHITVLGLEGLAYAHLAFLFWKLAGRLASDPASPPTLPVKWDGQKNSRNNYRAMCEIPLEISKNEFDRRMRVFGGNHFGILPTINLHGIEFRAVLQPSATADADIGSASTGSTGTTTNNPAMLPTTTGSSSKMPPAASKPDPWSPDHAVFNATKDEPKAMPEFEYSNN